MVPFCGATSNFVTGIFDASSGLLYESYDDKGEERKDKKGRGRGSSCEGERNGYVHENLICMLLQVVNLL